MSEIISFEKAASQIKVQRGAENGVRIFTDGSSLPLDLANILEQRRDLTKGGLFKRKLNFPQSVKLKKIDNLLISEFSWHASEIVGDYNWKRTLEEKGLKK